MKDMEIGDMMEMIDYNKPCRVYYNLHKRLFSVTQKNERNNWVVVAHVNQIELKKVMIIYLKQPKITSIVLNVN